MLRMLKSGISSYLTFVARPAAPVLRPYRVPLAPHRAMVRKTVFLAICAFVGIIYGFVFTAFPPFFVVILAIPILLLIMLAIWALPDQEVAPTRLLTFLIYLLLLLTVLWPNYLAIALPGLPWISVRRIIGPMMAITLLICLSISSDFRKKTQDALKGTPFLYYGMVGFIVIQVVTLFWSNPPFTNFFVVIDHQFLWTAAFFASVWVFQQPGTVGRYALLMMGMALFLGFVGAAEYKHQAILWANHIPSFLQVGDESVQRMLESNFRDGRYRIATTFTSSLNFSEFLAMVSPFVLHRIVNAKSVVACALWAAADIALLILIYMTTARLGMVGWIAAHGFYVMVWAIRRWRHNRSDLLAAALLVALPAMAAAVLIGLTSVDAITNRTIGGGSTGLSDEGRKAQFRMAPPVIMRNPLGYGAAMGGEALDFRTPSGFLTIDSYILSVVLDYGIIGFILFYGTMLNMVWRTSKMAVDEDETDPDIHLGLAVAASIIAFLAAKLVLSQEDNHSIYFILLGMACALQARHRRRMSGGEGGGAPVPAG